MKSFNEIRGGSSSSAILEALNRGSQNSVSTFGSVDQFIQGLLGPNFIKDKKESEIPNQKIEGEKINYNKKIEDEEEETNKNIKNNDFLDTEEDPIYDEEIESSEKSLYKIYRDREETFECDISIQGAKLSSSQVRLIFDHEICNVVFYGKIFKEGKCKVPLKKMNFYPEGSKGRVRLEVIVDDTVFVPWEETFVVEGAKKVTVQIKSQKKVDVRF
jgi:hypothetical protein